MKESGKRRLYSEQFKKEAASLVTEHGYSIVQAAQVVDTSEKNLQRWVKQQVELELSYFDGQYFYGVEKVSTCESGLQFIAI